MKTGSYRPGRSILLSGIKHSGKSTTGKLLAKTWGIPFFDLDDLMVDLCREERGGVKSVTWEPREIYRRLGRKGFQELEIRTLKAHRTVPGPYVLALGGGTQEQPEAGEILSGMGILVYLHEDANLLYRRIEARGIPPFLQSDSPRTSFLKLYAARDGLYRAGADLTVALEGRDTPQAAARIIQALEEYQHGG